MEKISLDGERIFVLRDFLTPAECEAFIEASERTGYADATIATLDGPVLIKDVRNNTRVMVDDVSLAARLWQRARPQLPERMASRSAVGFNERMRYYRYDPGQKFEMHYDGFFGRPNGERSFLTFMIYLNDDFTGGETRFYENAGRERLTVRPGRGMALVFEHEQLHEGAPVLTGRKYVLRTDVMYSAAER